MLEYVGQHREEAVKNQVEKETGVSWDVYIDAGYAQALENGSTLTKAEFEEATLEQIAATMIEIARDSPQYSSQDDWSISATNADGASNRLVSSGVVLKNGNVLPEYWANAAAEAPSETSKNAIKQELLNGRGVTIMYYADQNGPYSAAPGKSTNANTNHNQYVYATNTGVNHGVEIVGWDNGCSKDNFHHTVQAVDEHGQPVVDADATAATTPPDNGAWIVKNSWGSETDATEENADDLGNVMNKGTFGNLDKNGKAAGYFYLSYYDKSIKQPETMEFSANLGSEGSFTALQYDYMPANSGFYTLAPSSEVTSSANVFSTDDMDIVVKSVSTRTSETNMRVTFAIYQLNDNAKDPTDGEMLYRTSQNFEYGGFHRLDLDNPITFKAGTKFSVVSTASTLGENGKRSYSVSANRGLSEEATKYAIAEKGAKLKVYSKAVVNKGESYLYDGKEWKDWSEYLAALPSDAETQEVMPSDTYTQVCPIDNFSIKVYAEPVDNSQAMALEEAQKAQRVAEEKVASMVEPNTMTVKAKKVTVEVGKKKTLKKADAFTVKDAKGAVAFYKVSGNDKIAISKAGRVTVKSGLKVKKTYEANVLVVAAGGKVNGVEYAPIYKTVVLKVQVTKKANPIVLAKTSAAVEYAKLKKAKQTVAIKKATKAQGKVTYSITKAVKDKKSFKKEFSINKKTGMITVKKGLAKGAYKVTVKANAAGNANYKSGYKTAVVTVLVHR